MKNKKQNLSPNLKPKQVLVKEHRLKPRQVLSKEHLNKIKGGETTDEIEEKAIVE